MRAEILMPSLGYDMESGRIGEWLKHVGDRIERGEPIAEIETDKATIEMEALHSGTLTQIVVAAGQEAALGEVIAYLETEA
jgi:pyruvate dehydrogenase E2 component (dihydrolipoamide acetyltransferase)